MALHFELTTVPDWETTCYTGTGADRRMSGVTETLIFATMMIGMSRITEANVDKFSLRIAQHQAAAGPLMRGWDEAASEFVGVPVTDADVRAHIGLSTNASAKTDARWKTDLLDTLTATAHADIRKQAAR